MIYENNGEQFDLIPNRVNSAVKGMLTQLRDSAVDLQARNLLKSAERLLSKANEDIIAALRPSPEETPCVRVFGGQRLYDVQPVSFVRLDGTYKIPLYFVYHSLGEESFEEFRESHIDMCIRWLEEPDEEDTSNIGMKREAWQDWGFKIQKWNCIIDHDTPLKFLRMENLLPPFYCSRVDLEIQVNQIGAENDG